MHLRDLKPTGDYVMVLDDDDVLTDDTVIEQLAQICAERRPQVAIMQMDLCGRVLPDEWPPRHDHIAVSCWAVANHVWQAHALDFGARYAGDYDFISAVLGCAAKHDVWHTSIVVARADRIGHGAPYGVAA